MTTYEERLVITPPDITLTPDGKLRGVCHIAICEVVIVDGRQKGKSRPHRCSLVIQPDGSWQFAVAPRHPETGLLYTFKDAEVAAWNAMLDVYEERYGVETLAMLADGLTAESAVLRIVEYQQNDAGTFDRAVEDVTIVFAQTDARLSHLSDRLTLPMRTQLAAQIEGALEALKATVQ